MIFSQIQILEQIMHSACNCAKLGFSAIAGTVHNLFQNLNLRKYHLFEQLKLNGRVFRVMTSPSKTHAKLGRKGTRTKHFRYVNCSRRIIIRHVACKRGYFWPFPYLEIKIKQIGGIWMGGVFSNNRPIQCQHVQNRNV